VNTFAKNIEMRGNVTSGMDRISDMPRASVYRNAGLTPASGAVTTIIWDTLEYDTDGFWSGATTTKLTVQTQGIYLFNAWCDWAGSITGFRQLYLKKNATSLIAPVSETGPTNAASCSQSTSAQVPMNSGDFMEVIATQTAGGALSFNAATLTNRLNGFQACLISTS